MKLRTAYRRLPDIGFRLVFAFLIFLIAAAKVSAAPSQSHLALIVPVDGSTSRPGPADGPGVWMNIWNYPDSTHAQPFCAELAAHGVRNCFVQTSRSNTDAIAHPAELGSLIQACHHYSIRVIAWSFTQLSSPAADAQRLLAAARFKTGGGESVDGIASDMESNLTPDNIGSLGQALRTELGSSYPLIAIVYSPLNHSPDAALTPWKLLTKYFDIIAPMTYWSGKKQTIDAYTYTCTTIKQIREAIGKSDVEIQPIGDAMYSKPYELAQFMKACRENEATGISLYPNQKLTPAQLACLDKYGSYFPPNARFRLAAYHQLCLSGIMPEPPQDNPSSFISRGRFYQLLLSQISKTSKDSTELTTQVDAYQYLVRHGVAPETADRAQLLSSPIGVSEAMNTLAALVKNHHKPWLMQSAKAADATTASPASRTQPALLNYIEAAQLVTQARAGLH